MKNFHLLLIVLVLFQGCIEKSADEIYIKLSKISPPNGSLIDSVMNVEYSDGKYFTGSYVLEYNIPETILEMDGLYLIFGTYEQFMAKVEIEEFGGKTDRYIQNLQLKIRSDVVDRKFSIDTKYWDKKKFSESVIILRDYGDLSFEVLATSNEIEYKFDVY